MCGCCFSLQLHRGFRCRSRAICFVYLQLHARSQGRFADLLLHLQIADLFANCKTFFIFVLQFDRPSCSLLAITRPACHILFAGRQHNISNDFERIRILRYDATDNAGRTTYIRTKYDGNNKNVLLMSKKVLSASLISIDVYLAGATYIFYVVCLII